MLPRVLLIFVFLVLIVLAAKRGMSPSREIVQQVPGYPTPVALKKMNSVSDEEFLRNLPSAGDYAFSFDSEKVLHEVKPKPVTVGKRKIKLVKRTFITKTKFVKR